jgi:hypothetical protein
MAAVFSLEARITELTEPINFYNNLERNYPTEPHRNRAEPILSEH